MAGRDAIEIKHISDRIMTMKLVAENTMLNIIPQQEKDQLYENLESAARRIRLHGELCSGI